MRAKDWPRVKISNLCDLIVDCVNKTAPSVDYATPYKMIRTPNIKNGKINLTNCRNVEKVTYESWTRRATVDRGDVLLTREAPMGEVGLVNFDDTVFLGQRIMQYRANSEVLDSNYLLYTFLSPNLQSQFRKHDSTGSIVSHIRVPDCSEFEISAPPLSIQRKLSKVLRDIDDKIEVNNQINSELKSMAKTIYDYWFIQFDFPDSQHGKPYKSSAGKMKYNPMLKREIPENWECKSLSEITSVSNQSIDPAQYPDRLFRHFSIPILDATQTYGIEAGKTIGSNKFTIEENDILVSKLNPWFNRIIYAMREEDLICSTEFVVWRTPNNSIKNFLYMVASSPQFIAHCTQSATGTSNSHKRVNPDVMMRFKLPFNYDIATNLGNKLEPIIKQMIINQRMNAELEQLRDWLLPMLMNGQVTVK